MSILITDQPIKGGYIKRCFECGTTDSTISTFWRCTQCGRVVCRICQKGTNSYPIRILAIFEINSWGWLIIMRSVISQIKTQENDDFRLIKTLDKDNVWRLYVEGNININIEWLKQEHAGLHKSGIAMSPSGILPCKPRMPTYDPFTKYGQTTILEQEEKACISVFKDKYKNLSKSEKLNIIIREIVMP